MKSNLHTYLKAVSIKNFYEPLGLNRTVNRNGEKYIEMGISSIIQNAFNFDIIPISHMEGEWWLIKI